MQHEEQITKFIKQLQVKRYAPSTIKTYKNNLKDFSLYFKKQNLSNITHQDIFRYIEHKIKDEKISFSYQKGLVGAIKLFYSLIYLKNINIDYIYPDRSESKLPRVLSSSDIAKLIASTKNL